MRCSKCDELLTAVKRKSKQCKKCRNDYLKQWASANSDKRRAQKYRHRYGIDLDDYNALLDKQHGRCAICMDFGSSKLLYVDHDHTTERIRGLLCQKCNTAIGLLKEDFQIVGQAAEYLKGLNNA